MIISKAISVVTAALLSAGASGVTASSAAAHEFNGDYGGPGFIQTCKPIFRQVLWYDRRGYLHASNQFVGQKCWPVAMRRHDDGGDWNGRGQGGDRRWDNGGDSGQQDGDWRHGRDRGYGGGGNGWSFQFGFGG